MGAREALSWLKDKGQQHVILATDAQVVKRAVDNGIVLTPFRAIVRDIRTFLQQNCCVTFEFVKREANISLCFEGESWVDYCDFLPAFLSTCCNHVMMV